MAMQTVAAPPKTTLPSLIREGLAKQRDDALIERVGGVWTPTSSERALQRVIDVACGLRDLGLNPGDRVALLAQDRVDWLVSDFGVLLAGLVVVPIFPTQALDQVEYILQNSEAKLLIVDSRAALERLQPIAASLPQIVLFDSDGPDSLAALEMRGAQARTRHPDWPVAFESQIRPDDLAVLIYTSGTTGRPKGVMLSHNNVAFNVQASFRYGLGDVHAEETVMSVLPFSHIYEHMIAYGFILVGTHYYICHSPDELLVDMRDVRPVMMTSVPRIFERVLAGITGKALKEGGVRGKLIPWALAVGRDYRKAQTLGQPVSPMLSLKYRLAHALVLRKIRPMLGLDRLKFFVSGSAALHLDTAMTFLGFDVTIIEGYGPTECSPVVSVNRLLDNRYATVGRPIPGVTVRLDDDGEILVRGPGVMLGYYKDETATSEALRDGWYHTGDVGITDADGFLKITDRKKELFKTSGGKFLAPARVESAIKRSVYVNQVMLVGESRPHPLALVSPNWDLIRTALNLPANVPTPDLAKRTDVNEFLTQEVRSHTADLASFEQVWRIVVLPHELTIEAGELSPTMKVKRRVVEQRYSGDIERAYAAMASKA